MVKWFVEEEASAEVDRVRRAAVCAVSGLTAVEVVSALARRHREGSISARTLDHLVATVGEELESVVVVELSDNVLRRARSLLLRHPLRSGDAIQLASCVDLRDRLEQPVAFLAFDQRLNEAAVREGLRLAL